jgi:Tfp pilus assembly protein PilX
MRRHQNQEGFSLILLIGITAALAILAATLVMMLDNQQHATSKERSSKTSLYYAEAALNSAANAVETNTAWLTAAYSDQTAMGANYNTIAGAPAVTYRVYDNATPINYGVNYDQNQDGEVWVETTTTYLGKKSVVRELVSSSTKVSILPKAAAWTDTDMVMNGTSNIYGVKNDGTADDSGAPYVTSVMVGDDFTGNGSANLAYPGHTVQSLGLQVNGDVTNLPTGVTHTPGGVGLLSDYFDGAHQAALMTEAQAAINGKATLFNASGTAVTKTTTPYTNWTTTSGTTWTAPTNTDYVVPTSCNSGDLTLSSASGKSSTFNFNKLYVADDLTISGNTTVNTTGLYVGGDLTITGTSAADVHDSLGPIYVGGTISWEGAANSNAHTLYVTTASSISSTPGPVYARIIWVDGNSSGTYDSTNKPGPTNITLGPTWIDGDAGTSHVAVDFAGPTSTASTLMCPLLATTEQSHWNGLVNTGNTASPMVYFMQNDNDGLQTNDFHYDCSGTFTGLMINFEAEMYMTDGSITGAVLEGCPKVPDDSGVDLTMSGDATICYNQAVIDNCTSDALKTTSTGVVPGSWQQLSSY